MKVAIAALVLIVSTAAHAENLMLSQDRANAVMPFLVQAREKALNDAALCSADLMMARQRIAELERQMETITNCCVPSSNMYADPKTKTEPKQEPEPKTAK
jgi:hypothetical protein